MGKRILLVDDSRTLRRRLRALLETQGYDVEEAEDGLRGFAAARRARFDLLLVDLNMPRMNGLLTIAAVRKLAGYAATPIFILTTESSVSAMDQGRRVGATAWIVKPPDPSRLLESIRSALEP